MRIDVYCIGYKQKSAAWAALLVATADDGRQISETRSGSLGDITKNVADVVAVINGLQCVKPEFRSGQITLHAPTGYAYSMLERADGQWQTAVKQNGQYIDSMRAMYGVYAGIVVDKIDTNSEQFKQLIAIVKPLGKEEYANRVERVEAVDIPSSDGTADQRGTPETSEV